MAGVVNKLCYPKERFSFDDLGYSKYAVSPGIRPTLALNFIENPSVNQQGATITVTRAGTSATYFDKDGILQTPAADTARFDYNPVTGACRGLLVETGATNLMLYSRDCTQGGSWTRSNCNAALTQVGIDGVANSASLLTASAGNGTCFQSITSASAARVFSAYIKRVTGTGTISMTLDGGSTYTDITSQVISGRWTRVKINQTLANPSVGFKITTSGDAIAVDYMQCESSNFETSPILSVSGQGVRNSDVVSISTLTPWYNQNAGTIYGQGLSSNGSPNGVNQYLVAADDTTANERHIIFRANGTKAPTAFTSDGGVTQVTLNTGTWNDLTVSQLAYAYSLNDCAASFAGAAIQTDTSATMPTVTNLKLGVSQASSSFWDGYIRRIIYWNYRLSNAMLVTVTT